MRREEVERRYLRYEKPAEIADALGISLATVRADIRVVERGWVAQAEQDLTTVRARLLAELRELKREYRQGYEQSCRPREITVTSQTQGVVLVGQASSRREPARPNPAFLAGIRRCTEVEARLYGLPLENQSKEEPLPEPRVPRSEDQLEAEKDRLLRNLEAEGYERQRSMVQPGDRLPQGFPHLGSWCGLHRVIEGQPFDFLHHRYLGGIYRDESPFMVIMKAAQMGMSEYAISRALWFACTKGGRTIYYFPTENDVAEFSRDRFAPAIRDSPYLTSQVKETDNVSLKRIGQGSLYFRGTNSRTRMKSVPADFLIFDEIDEMLPANVELARKRLGHSAWGWELDVSTPSLPAYGVHALFEKTDQRHWLLRCGCGEWLCLEDAFLRFHGANNDPRQEIIFVKGEPGWENIVCLKCGRPLYPEEGEWVAKFSDRPARGYQISKFISSVVSEQDKALGSMTRPAALLRLWQTTQFPGEFYNSEMGLPHLAAEGGLTEDDLLKISGRWGMPPVGLGCVMGVDQGNGLHLVIKEPHEDSGLVFTVRVHHEPMTDAIFSHLDYYMETYDVQCCIIDALPNTHAARAFAQRHQGRVWCSYYGGSQKGTATYGFDTEGCRTATINRTEALDAWRDAHKMGKRRIPRREDEVDEFIRQMTNVLRKIEEDPATGQKKAEWIQRGPDHYAHADSYAEIALRRSTLGLVRGEVLG